MNIFSILNSVLFSKKEIDINLDDEGDFSSYMINRWSSMYSPEMCQFINETSNRYISIFPSKSDQYYWFLNFMPRLRFKKISYIKKTKKETVKEETSNIDLLAANNEISRREVELYNELFGVEK